MRIWLIAVALLLSACTKAPEVSGLGHQIPVEQAISMAKADSPIVEVTRTDKYTSPPTVHVIYGKDKDGRDLIAWVYTTVIRDEYADKLMSAERATEIAREHNFPVAAIQDQRLHVFQGRLNGRDNPIFWKLGTRSGWIWVDAETGEVLKRLDAE